MDRSEKTPGTDVMADNPGFIDTHCHLDFPDFEHDRQAVIERALTGGVPQMVSIGTGRQTSTRAVELSHLFAAVHATAGLHPGSVDEHFHAEIDGVQQLARDHHLAAIGECGLDYHRPPEPPAGVPADSFLKQWKDRQHQAFIRQLDLAAELKLNVVLHQRDSWDDTLHAIQPYSGRLRAVFHCFGGTLEQAHTLLDMGHLVSFTGIVTFKNATQVQHCAKHLPAASFMVETDCPYLAPTPHRGQRCEPAMTRLVGEAIAKLRDISADALAEETTRTAEAFFRLEKFVSPPTTA